MESLLIEILQTLQMSLEEQRRTNDLLIALVQAMDEGEDPLIDMDGNPI